MESPRRLSYSTSRVTATRRMRGIAIIAGSLFCAALMISTSNGGGIRRVFPFTNNGYITSKFGLGMRGRLGNNLFEMLSLLGIAKTINRTPYLEDVEEYHGFLKGKLWKKIVDQFPLLMKQFAIFHHTIPAQNVGFHGGQCCIWQDPEVLLNKTEDAIRLQGDFFQSYKYFDHLRDDIRKWLLPNEIVQKKVQAAFPANMKDRFLVCVHIRREDFLINKQKEASSANFSISALNYIYEKSSSNETEFGAIILGNAVKWEKETFGQFPNTLVMENTTPEEDFALARMYCDVVLITAPSSSFGFFLGYLSKTMNVYYRDITDTKDKTQNEMKQEDFFLPHWIRIRDQNGTIVDVSSHKKTADGLYK